MSWALVATLLVASAIAWVLKPPSAVTTASLALGLVVPYAALAALGVVRLRRAGQLREQSRFRPGDPSLGIAVGVLALLSAWALSRWLLPQDSAAHAWLLRIFLVVGGGASSGVTACLLITAALEELVWRGWLQTELALQLGVRRGWVVGALFYAAAHAATLPLLCDAVAGPNPLIVLTALGSGLCWGFLRERTGRLMPGLFSHLAFAYLATQYLNYFI